MAYSMPPPEDVRTASISQRDMESMERQFGN